MSKRQKTVLITGAAGFIGKNLIKRIESFKDNVVLVDRLSSVDVDLQNIDYYKCDLSEGSDIRKLAKRIKGDLILLHLAAYVPKSSNKKDDSIDKSIAVNFKATVNLLDGIKDRLHKVCFASTLEVYGRPVYLPIDERHPLNPRSFYGLSKLLAEKYLSTFCKTHRIPLAILRLSSVYGPGEIYDRAIPNFIRQALKGLPLYIYGDGQDVRDYVCIDDVTSALIASVNSKEISGIFNIASGKGYAINEIAKLIIKLSQSKSKIKLSRRRKERYNLIFDISKAEEKIGFRPKTSIKQGLADEISWFKASMDN